MATVPFSPDGFGAANAASGAQPNAPYAQFCAFCETYVRIEAHYDDAWRTPLAPQPLMVQYLEGSVIDGGGETRSVMSFGTQDGQVTDAIRPDLGSHMTAAPYAGAISAEIVEESGPDPAALERSINADIGAFVTAINTALQPWITEWQDEGLWGLFGTIFEGIQNGMGAWLSGEGEFWASIGEWISNIPDMLGDAWDSVSDHFKRLWDNREHILRLIEQLAHGLVNEFEEGLAALADVINSIPGLEEIGGILSDLVERSAHWAQAMIELTTRTTVLRNLTAAVLSVVMIIPPNFYAEMVSTGVGYLLPEVIIAILLAIIAFFTAGGGAPALYARISAFVLRVTTQLSQAGRAGRALLRVFALFRTIADKVVDLVRGLKARIVERAEGSTGQVTRLRRTVARHDVECFDLPPNANRAEFRRQLDEQQATINRMTADEMAYAHNVLDQARAEKARQVAAGTWSGGSFTDLLRDGSAQRRARAEFAEELDAQGYSDSQIEEIMGDVNATHFLDIIAGGDPSNVGIGGAAENQGIGRQWPQGSRSAGLGQAAHGMRENGLANARMNVRLEIC